MTTALYSHPACVGHAVPAGHPECPDRLRAIEGALNAPGFAGLLRLEAPEVAEAALGRAHDRAYLDALAAAIPARGLRALDADTHVGPGALGAARRAAGAVTAAVALVLGGGAGAVDDAHNRPSHHDHEDDHGHDDFASFVVEVPELADPQGF
ncbi:MAG: histone deacetylase family protein, partial [Gemmobacter sp.]